MHERHEDQRDQVGVVVVQLDLGTAMNISICRYGPLPCSFFAASATAYFTLIIELEGLAQRIVDEEVDDGPGDDKEVCVHDERAYFGVPV